jgi:hypothetical protein
VKGYNHVTFEGWSIGRRAISFSIMNDTRIFKYLVGAFSLGVILLTAIVGQG